MYLFLAGFFCCAAVYVVAQLIVNWRAERALKRAVADLERLRALSSEEPEARPTAFDKLEQTIDASNQRFVSASRLLPLLQVDLMSQMREVEQHLLTHTICGRLRGFSLHYSLDEPTMLTVKTAIDDNPLCISTGPMFGEQLSLYDLFARLHERIDETTYLHKRAANGGEP